MTKRSVTLTTEAQSARSFAWLRRRLSRKADAEEMRRAPGDGEAGCFFSRKLAVIEKQINVYNFFKNRKILATDMRKDQHKGVKLRDDGLLAPSFFQTWTR